MDSPFIIPLAVFAMVALIVAIVIVAKIHDLEVEIQTKLHAEELEHRSKMQELDLELTRVREAK